MLYHTCHVHISSSFVIDTFFFVAIVLCVSAGSVVVMETTSLYVSHEKIQNSLVCFILSE